MVEPVPTDEAFRLVLRSRGFAPRIVEGRPSDLPTELDLLPGARLIGRVVDGDSGEAIEGVVISVDYWIDPSLPWPMSRIKRSDSTGSWEVGALPPGETFVVVRHPGFGRFWRRVVVEEGQRLDLGTAILHRGADLKAEVVDDLGRPVPGATVRVDNGPGATVDEEGLVSLTGIPLSGAELAVSAESHLPQTMPIRAPFPETLRIRLTRAYHVMARFVDADGLPVTAGTAAIETGTSTTFQGLDGQGRLAADLPPDVEYSLVLEGPTTPAVRLRIPAGGPGNQWDLGTIEAPRGYVAEGTVLSAETGEPLSAARVWTLRPSAQGPVVAWMQKKFIETTTAGDGRFVLGGLPSGQIALRVESPGYARVHVEVGFDEGEDALVDVGLIRIPRGSELRVEVSSAETKGMTARLDLRGEGLPADFLHATVRGAEAVFPRVAPGTYDLVVQRGPKEICAQSISIGDAPESVECEGADVRVEGIVVVGDRTSGRGTLVWRSREQSDRSFPEGIMNVTTSSGLRRQSTFTTRRTDVVVPVDRDGWFETLGVSSGAWKVAWYPDSGGAGASVDVDVPQVETFEVTLRYPSIEISGLVVDEDGKPLPDARVRDLLSGNLALSGAGGEFRLTGLSPGPVELQARLRMLESEVLSLTVEADRSVEPPTLVVRETSDRVLRVEVVAENGQPAPSAFVFFHTGSGADQIATTDIYGAVAFRLPDPPPQQFRVAAFTGGAWILGNQLNAGDLDGVVKLAPKPSGTIIVVSEMAAGSPAIVSAAGWNLSWLLTRVGMRPMVGTDSELRLRGIPEGAYTVTLRDATATVSVRRDRESIVELDGS
ncbi:MAG: carboxypeptidase regulatory-like domain-containing protein [Gemmatimonadota bacterium]